MKACGPGVVVVFERRREKYTEMQEAPSVESGLKAGGRGRSHLGFRGFRLGDMGAVGWTV